MRWRVGSRESANPVRPLSSCCTSPGRRQARCWINSKIPNHRDTEAQEKDQDLRLLCIWVPLWFALPFGPSSLLRQVDRDISCDGHHEALTLVGLDHGD